MKQNKLSQPRGKTSHHSNFHLSSTSTEFTSTASSVATISTISTTLQVIFSQGGVKLQSLLKHKNGKIMRMDKALATEI